MICFAVHTVSVYGGIGSVPSPAAMNTAQIAITIVRCNIGAVLLV